MTIEELARNNYPQYWNKSMLEKLLERKKISQKLFDELTTESVAN